MKYRSLRSKSCTMFLVIVIVILVAGCRIQNRSTLESPKSGSAVTKAATNSVQPTNEVKEIITTPTSNGTGTDIVQSSTPQILKNLLFSPCLEISIHSLEREKIPWDLIVEHSKIPYIYDAKTDLKIDMSDIPGRYIPSEYFISEDGKWVSYQDSANSVLYVEPAENLQKNDPIKRIEWKKPLHFVEGWFSDNSLLITRKPEGKEFLSTVIFNPFSGEEHEFSLENLPNYKYFKAGGVGAYMFGHSNLMPDPSLTRLVYPGLSNNQDANIILWDNENKVVLAKLDKFYESIYNDPLWSRDGSDFLIVNVGPEPDLGLEWFQVTRNGSVKQITNFGEFLENRPEIAKAARSPDGNYLAFQIQYKWQDQTLTKYLVIDLRSTKLEGFCIDSVLMEEGEDQAPVWSPDSRFLAVSNTRINSIGDLILVEIQTRKMDKLTTDVHAIGWIEKPSN